MLFSSLALASCMAWSQSVVGSSFNASLSRLEEFVRAPQSEQSVANRHEFPIEPGPPSWHNPSPAH